MEQHQTELAEHSVSAAAKAFWLKHPMSESLFAMYVLHSAVPSAMTTLYINECNRVLLGNHVAVETIEHNIDLSTTNVLCCQLQCPLQLTKTVVVGTSVLSLPLPRDCSTSVLLHSTAKHRPLHIHSRQNCACYVPTHCLPLPK